jgi:hypothetical protein
VQIDIREGRLLATEVKRPSHVFPLEHEPMFTATSVSKGQIMTASGLLRRSILADEEMMRRRQQQAMLHTE